MPLSHSSHFCLVTKVTQKSSLLLSASPKFGQKEVVKITKFNNFKDKLRDEKEIHRITNCICH